MGMDFAKRAGLTLWSRKGRTVLLMVISTIILIFVLAGLIVQRAALLSVKTATNSAGSTVTLTTNRETAFKQMQKEMSSSNSSSTTTRPEFKEYTTSISNVKKIATLSNVASYNITNSAQVNASGFEAVTTTTDTSHGGFGGGMDASSTMGSISLSGVSTTAATSAFANGTAKITSGTGITSSDANTNNVVISKELAKSNNLTVGKTIKVTYTDSDSNTKTYTLKVVGIYTAKSNSAAEGFQSSANTIYTSYTLPNTIEGTPNQASQVTFTMADSSKTSAFVKAAKKDINTTQMSLTSDTAQYKTMAKQMKSVAGFANKIVWVVSIAGTLILGLIIILITRERRREMGILLALGESKPKVFGQLLTEMLIVLAVSFGIAAGTGQIVGKTVGQQLLTQAQQASANNTAGAPGGAGMPGSSGGTQGQASGGAPTGGRPTGMANGGGKMMATGVKAQTLQTVVTPATLLELGGVALLITIVSLGGAGASIMRMQPKQILLDN